MFNKFLLIIIRLLLLLLLRWHYSPSRTIAALTDFSQAALLLDLPFQLLNLHLLTFRHHASYI